MAKKKLSANELRLKKMATLAMATFATKNDMSSAIHCIPSDDPASLLN